MKHLSPLSLLVATAAALVLPPFLLVPLIYGLPRAQLFKDFYEACLWISPAVGVLALVIVLGFRWRGVVSLRQPAILSVVLLACLDLISPLLFYMFLALISGH